MFCKKSLPIQLCKTCNHCYISCGNTGRWKVYWTFSRLLIVQRTLHFPQECCMLFQNIASLQEILYFLKKQLMPFEKNTARKWQLLHFKKIMLPFHSALLKDTMPVYRDSACLTPRYDILNHIWPILHVHLYSVSPLGSHPIPPKPKKHANPGEKIPRHAFLFFLCLFLRFWVLHAREEINCRSEVADGSREMLQRIGSWQFSVFCVFSHVFGDFYMSSK